MKEQNRLVLVKGMGYLFACRNLVTSSVSHGGIRWYKVMQTVVRLRNTVKEFHIRQCVELAKLNECRKYKNSLFEQSIQ